jgi:hypothetical protein
VFAFIDGAHGAIKPIKAVVVLGFIGIGGLISLVMSGTLAGLEAKPVPRAKLAKTITRAQFAATLCLMMGVGGFVQTFMEVLL